MVRVSPHRYKLTRAFRQWQWTAIQLRAHVAFAGAAVNHLVSDDDGAIGVGQPYLLSHPVVEVHNDKFVFTRWPGWARSLRKWA